MGLPVVVWGQTRSRAAQRDPVSNRQGTGGEETSSTPDFALSCLCNLQSLIRKMQALILDQSMSEIPSRRETLLL